MFKIKNTTIHCSRGDKGTFMLKLPYTDDNDYIKYQDNQDNVYWYDNKNDKLYDSDYNESSVPLNTLTIQLYEFQVNDKIKLNVYEKNGYEEEPLMTKEVVILTEAESVTISLNEEDTTFGEISNKPITYWYDITLNGDQTVVCYNEQGAKEFIQYPAKGDEE